MRRPDRAFLYETGLVLAVIAFGLYFDHAASRSVTPSSVKEVAGPTERAAQVPKESIMSSTTPGKGREAGKARHGPRSEVTWEGGSGRQPYGNQGDQEAAEPNAADDAVPEGNRGERSGRNLEQLEKARRKP